MKLGDMTKNFGSYLTICLQKNVQETKLVVRGEPLAGDLVKKKGGSYFLASPTPPSSKPFLRLYVLKKS